MAKISLLSPLKTTLEARSFNLNKDKSQIMRKEEEKRRKKPLHFPTLFPILLHPHLNPSVVPPGHILLPSSPLPLHRSSHSTPFLHPPPGSPNEAGDTAFNRHEHQSLPEHVRLRPAHRQRQRPGISEASCTSSSSFHRRPGPFAVKWKVKRGYRDIGWGGRGHSG